MYEKRKNCLWIVAVLGSLLLLLSPALMPVAIAQQGSSTIKGKILSGDGTPLVGATINVRNTNRSTITGSNGQFELTGITPDAVLVISFTGYTTLERQVNNQ